MRRSATYVAAQHELSQTDAARSVMEEGAAAAGLAWPPASFSEVGTLRERLAASPFLMAPMASVTDAAYRMVMRAGGAALAYTEMVSVTGIHYASDTKIIFFFFMSIITFLLLPESILMFYSKKHPLYLETTLTLEVGIPKAVAAVSSSFCRITLSCAPLHTMATPCTVGSSRLMSTADSPPEASLRII